MKNRHLFDRARAFLVSDAQRQEQGVSTRSFGSVIVATGFIAYLMIGLAIYRDYGCFWDAGPVRNNGNFLLDYILSGNWKSGNFGTISGFHGPVWLIFMSICERFMGFTDGKDILQMRFLLTFLMNFFGVICLYLLGCRLFHSRVYGACLALALVTTPRLFPHLVYNSEDAVCMTFFVIGFLTQHAFISRPTLLRGIIHGTACGIAMANRNFALFIPGVTVMLLAVDVFVHTDWRAQLRARLSPALAFAVTAMGVTYVCWPVLWPNPIASFINSFKIAVEFPWHDTIRYCGADVHSTQLPWHYNGVWMLVTIPIVYSVFLVIGLYFYVADLCRGGVTLAKIKDSRLTPIVLWLVVPLVMPAILGSTLYNGWRHHYFVYPAFLILSVYGVVCLLSRGWAGARPRRMAGAIVVILIVQLSVNIFDVIRLHPHQYVDFNVLAGRNPGERFEMDYWGVSYREALQFVADQDQHATVLANRFPIYLNLNLLDYPDRQRIELVEYLAQADYVFAMPLEAYDMSSMRIRYEVRAGRNVILTVLQRRRSPADAE